MMSQIITISAITANTPVSIYYCDSMSANCVTVTASTETFPFTFTVPDNESSTDFIIKIVDTNNCEVGQTIFITPTPTTTQTPTTTPTPTVTPTVTVTNTQTSSQTPTFTPTNSVTPTFTSTPTATPNVSIHYIGKNFFLDNNDACNDMTSITPYFTYISECDTIPVIGATIYSVNNNGTLYNPVNGNNKYIKMTFGIDNYGVKISNFGLIIDFNIC